VITNGPGELDIRRAVTAMAGDLQELFAETKILSGFDGREKRVMSAGHLALLLKIRVGPWEELSTR
jgi:hypothetical protein